jgi:hypothetical protein
MCAGDLASELVPLVPLVPLVLCVDLHKFRYVSFYQPELFVVLAI